MRSSLMAVCCLTLVFFGTYAFSQPTIVGEYVPSDAETTHPYESVRSERPVLSRTDHISYPEATYIALHFSSFQLGAGDFVVVRSPDQSQFYRYTDLGRGDLGMSTNGFFATHIKGDTAIVELWTGGGESGYGYTIDFYGRGYNNKEIQAFWDEGLGEVMNLPAPESDNRSICTANDTREAKCYQLLEPEAYDTSRAVARLLLNGNAHCTGWLVGCEGHVMTNEHCIGSQSQANNIDFEFMAEGADCATNCASSLACGGVVEASGSTLVAVNAALDYAFVIPNTSTGGGTDLPATYGYMRLRPTGAVLGERIYIPQHPAGWGKHLAMESTYPEDVNGYPTVTSINETGCSGGPGDVGYWADTQGGSSGSPVLGYSDNLVIALHHCRGDASCASGTSGDDPNRAVPIQAVIDSLGATLPACAICTPPAIPASASAQGNGDNRIDISWSASSGATSYNVYRAQGQCPQTAYELLASGVTGTSFSDMTPSGSVTYSYSVTAVDDATSCESSKSDCTSASTTGICLVPPTFDGLVSAVGGQDQTCMITLNWNAGSSFCGTTVTYSVYRDITSGFTPGQANLVASCLTETSWNDFDVESGVTYFYIVGAEDDTSNGSGPCNSGLSDSNTNQLSAVAVGLESLFFQDDMESGATNWTAVAGSGDPGGTSPFSLVTSTSSSPSHSFFVVNEPSIKDQTLVTANAITLPDSDGLRLYFMHQVNTENNWDGGVLEYSLDGTSWFDINSGNGGAIPQRDRFLQNGYVDNLGGGPLNGRASWNGLLYGGDFAEVQVDLSDFANSSLKLRWRFSCDGSQASVGWAIDDVRISYFESCFSTPPQWSLEIWMESSLYHPFFDQNNNGYIDILDVIQQLPAN